MGHSIPGRQKQLKKNTAKIMNKKFALTGVAGYIAPRHLKAIKETGNNLVAALDLNDSVGILDSFFDKVDFFVDPERFDRHLEKLYRKGEGIDYMSICSPNFLHDPHIRMALRVKAHAICEKPLVLNPWNLDLLSDIEQETGRKVYNILQLREHRSIIDFRNKIQSEKRSEKAEIDLTYITTRGNWYLYSWKGTAEKSGGLATNIGIHFFDMLIWIFGKVETGELHFMDERTAAGYLELENARVKWYLSIDPKSLPEEAKAAGKRTHRSLTIDEEEFEFSQGFTDLHTVVYRSILDGKGFGLEDARPSVELAHSIRHSEPTGKNSRSHSFLNR